LALAVSNLQCLPERRERPLAEFPPVNITDGVEPAEYVRRGRDAE